jgi:DNA-binding MarR family transcriptional regulator
MTCPEPPCEAASPRWLTPRQQDAWVALSSLCLQLPSALDAQLQRDAHLGLFEYFVLSRLSMAPDRTLRMSELAFLANGSLSRLSNVVKRIEERGWVRRRPDPCDGRFTLAILTDEGYEQVVSAAPGHVEAVQALVFDGLDDDQVDQLTALARHAVCRTETELRSR